MIKKLFLTLVISFLAFTSFAQIHEPIKWSQELKVTGATTADVVFNATIDEGWHLYGLNLPKCI